jgi:hypothetical protein
MNRKSNAKEIMDTLQTKKELREAVWCWKKSKVLVVLDPALDKMKQIEKKINSGFSTNRE